MLFRSAFVYVASFAFLAKAQGQLQVVTECVNPNHVALTFDDGPYKNSQWVRQILNDAGIKGTFFYNGVNWDCIYYHIQDVKDIFADGHQIGSHTWNHLHLPQLSWDDIHNQMYLTERAIKRITGAQVAMMRPPFGDINDQVVSASFLRNQSVIKWNVDSGDADGKTAEESQAIYTQAIQDNKNGVLKGLLTLNHETQDETLSTVIPFAIQALQNAGFQFVTVAECAGLPAYQGEPGEPEPVDDSWQSDCVWP